MKVLITGGSGFIARHLYEQLKDSPSLEIITRNSKELNLLETDKVSSFLRENKFDIVVHSATWDVPAHSSKDPTKVLEYNLKMFFNIVRCDDYFGKLIYFGSGAEFTRDYWVPMMGESYFDQHVPNDQYGLSKYIMTKYTCLHSQLHSNCTKIINLRSFGVFGKYEDWRIRFTSHACYCALFDKPITIRQNLFFDYLYIDDLVKIVHWFFYNQTNHPVYNVCTSQVIDLKTIAEKVLSISGKKELPIIIDRPGLGHEYSGDNSLLMGELGLSRELKNFNFTPIDESLSCLYHWFVENKNSLPI